MWCSLLPFAVALICVACSCDARSLLKHGSSDARQAALLMRLPRHSSTGDSTQHQRPSLRLHGSKTATRASGTLVGKGIPLSTPHPSRPRSSFRLDPHNAPSSSSVSQPDGDTTTSLQLPPSAPLSSTSSSSMSQAALVSKSELLLRMHELQQAVNAKSIALENERARCTALVAATKTEQLQSASQQMLSLIHI